MTYEGLRLRIFKIQRKALANIRRKKLTNYDFTIISNNCWGGMIYESYNLSKKSPTIGLFFMAEDYIKFLKNIRGYLNQKMTFIKPEHSKWKKYVDSDKRFGSYPIGSLKINENGKYEEIEIFFLHYNSEEEAKEKWERRIKRINWNNMLIKFNDQNGCTEKHVRDFEQLSFKNKVCFTVKKYPKYKSVIRIKVPKSHGFIRASYEPFGANKVININDMINNL